jgi:hypothetical protein
MNHRFSLFVAGYTAYVPGLYFRQKKTLNSKVDLIYTSHQVTFKRYLTAADEIEAEFMSYIEMAKSLAYGFNIEIETLEEFDNLYFDWQKAYTQAFELEFPMTRIDYYYFFYGRKLAELRTHIYLAKLTLKLSLDFDYIPDLFVQAEKYIKDAEFDLAKLIAPSVLISSEHRQGYFSVLYKNLNQGFESLRKLDVKKIEEYESEVLIKQLDLFEKNVLDGFHACVKLLKELEV